MKRLLATLAATAALVVILAFPAVADFVNGPTTLPATKANLKPLPSGANPNFYFQASDYNALMGAANDLRSQITAGKFLGLAQQGSDPNPLTAYPTSNYLWIDTTPALHLYDGSDNEVAFGPVVTKGDVLVWNGTHFIKLAAGSNGQVVTADSTATSGLKYATPATGTVTSVACGTGLSGGTITSTGTCAVSNPLPSPSTKGDVAVFNGTSYVVLPAGANGTFLEASSGASDGVTWVTPTLPPTPTAAGKLLYDNGTSYSEGAACTTSQVVVGGGAGAYSCGNVPGAAIPYGSSSNTATQGNDARLPPTPSAGGGTYYDNGTTISELANGSAGQVFTSQGTTVAPHWTTPASTETLAAAYTAGASTADSVLTENSTNGPLTCNYSAIAATPTVGLSVANTTAALVGAKEQDSPSLELKGSSWSTGGSAAKTVRWLMSLVASGSGTASSDYVVCEDTGSGTCTERFRWKSGGSTYQSNTASGGTALTVNTSGTYSSGTLLDIQNNGTSKYQFDYSGNLRMQVASAGLCNAGATHCTALDYPSTGHMQFIGFSPEPAADGTLSIGQSAVRWGTGYFANLDTKRIYTRGTPLTSTEIVAGANWGASATVSSITASDSGGVFTITSNGAGRAANPTFTVTFKDGGWVNAPNCWSKFEASNDASYGPTSSPVTETTTSTALTGTVNNGIAPTGGDTYTFRFWCAGLL